MREGVSQLWLRRPVMGKEVGYEQISFRSDRISGVELDRQQSIAIDRRGAVRQFLNPQRTIGLIRLQPHRRWVVGPRLEIVQRAVLQLVRRQFCHRHARPQAQAETAFQRFHGRLIGSSH